MTPERSLSRGTILARVAALGSVGLIACGALALVLEASLLDGFQALDALRAVLIAVTTGWLAWGAVQAVLGLVARPARPATHAGPPTSRTAVLVPICNEDAETTFARVAAIWKSLADAGLAGIVDVAILSDTRDDFRARDERRWFATLQAETGAAERIFYRRRLDNAGRKAGNVEEFIRSSGGAYRFALILDADSLFEGATLAELIRRMEADPRLGLIQTVPRIVHARSLFGRAMQFASQFYAPVFGRGVARLQGRAGPFWGHNAIFRVRAFAESCGLPELRGQPPFGGHILSHDYVEAALLARAGWTVRLDADLAGSYEEGPETVLSFAKRDRRWCQGNLQYLRLLAAPGLLGWSRFVFVQCIMAYLVSVLWGLFLIVSVVGAVTQSPPDYFPGAATLFPVIPGDRTQEILGLALGVLGLLVLPKILILGHSAVTRRADNFAGALRAAGSCLADLAVSTLLAPVMLAYQTRAVLQVLSGRDGGWPSHQRGEGAIGLAAAWSASQWIVLTGLCGLGASALLVSELALWLLPVCLPMCLAPVLISLSSRPYRGGVFAAPTEIAPSGVLQSFAAIRAAWAAGSITADIPDAA